jgi:hypothetical protein
MFKAVWGFDPEEALRAQNAFRQDSVPASDTALAQDDGTADNELRIPVGPVSQILELRRVFEL